MRQLLTTLGAIALCATASWGAPADDAALCQKASGPQALAACDRAIASGQFSGPDLAKVHTNRGVERRRAGDIEGAIADYDAAINLSPNDQFAFNNRANLWRDKGNVQRAIKDYGAALAIDPGYTAAYVNRGQLYEKLNEIDRARADYQRALDMPPKYGNGRGGQEIARKRLAALREAEK